jgi:hypothetical protein
VNKACRLALAKTQEKDVVQVGTSYQETISAKLTPPACDLLIKADFINEVLSEEKGLESFSKLVNIGHIQEILFNLKAVIEAAKADGKNPAEILADRCI